MSMEVHANAEAAAATKDASSKPTRPLTAYHLFFQLEREYILQTTKDDGAASSGAHEKDDRPIGKQIDDGMPFRYRYIHLSPHWYASGSGKRVTSGKAPAKRKHRRTHGKISFLDLSKRIAERWANLEGNDNATKTYARKIAARELEGYKRKMKLFKDNGEVLAETCLSSDAGVVSTPEKLPAKNSNQHMPVTPPSPAKSVKFEESVKFNQQQASKAKQNAKREREDRGVSGTGMGMGDFAFHPVPSSYWRKRKNEAAKNGKAKPCSSEMARHAPYASNRYKGMHSASSRRSNPKDEEYIRRNFNTPEFNSARTDFESEMNSLLAGRGKAQVPSVNFSSDDVSGLMKVLSDGEE